MSEETHPEAFDDSTLPPLITLKDFDFATKNGWSVRFLRPQEHSQSDIISHIMFQLEEELQCSCGINSYWTPGNSQGFAPHYDDPRLPNESMYCRAAKGPSTILLR